MKVKKNIPIRNRCTEKGVFLYQVAKELGMSEYTFNRHLRYELPDEEQKAILDIIERLAEEND